MSFWILLFPFLLLSVWVYTYIDTLYNDLFLYSNFTEINKDVEWYYHLISPFYGGIPLWLSTVHYLFKMWQLKLFKFNCATFYLFVGYFSFLWMLLGHIYPLFWVTMLVLHIICLILVIRKIPQRLP
jgi:hypothetical protein